MSSPRFKILYVIDSLNIGGAEMQLMGLIRSCLAEGHQVSVGYFTPGVLSEERGSACDSRPNQAQS